MNANLVFIKTAKTAGDAVEIHIDSGASGFQQRLLDVTSGFDVGQAPNGKWILRYESNGSLVLLLVKTRETGAGRVEVHWDPPSVDDYQGGRSSISTPFTEAEAEDGTWLIPIMDNYSGPDVFFIKTAGTSSGAVELLLQNSVEKLGYTRWVTAFPAIVGAEGVWLLTELSRHGARPPDLAFVQTSGTDSGQVELSYATAASGYRHIDGGPWATGFDCSEFGGGTWHLADMNGDGRLDLGFVKTANTGSGRIEAYYAAAADGYQTVEGGYTEFDVADGPNGTWQLV